MTDAKPGNEWHAHLKRMARPKWESHLGNVAPTYVDVTLDELRTFMTEADRNLRNEQPRWPADDITEYGAAFVEYIHDGREVIATPVPAAEVYKTAKD